MHVRGLKTPETTSAGTAFAWCDRPLRNATPASRYEDNAKHDGTGPHAHLIVPEVLCDTEGSSGTRSQVPLTQTAACGPSYKPV